MNYPAHVTEATNYSYRERASRQPTLPEGETVIFDEPGRILPSLKGGSGTDCRSHYFMVTRGRYEHGGGTLRVHHGGGEEHWRLGWEPRITHALSLLDSDDRYRLLWTIMNAHKESSRAATTATEQRYEEAFLSGRLKKRKVRGTQEYKVRIEPQWAQKHS